MEIVLSRPSRRRRVPRSALVVTGLLGAALVALVLRSAGPAVQLVVVGVPAAALALGSVVVLLRAARPHRAETVPAPVVMPVERPASLGASGLSVPAPRAQGSLPERRALPERVGAHPLSGANGHGPALPGPRIPGPREPLAWTGPPRVPSPRRPVARGSMPVVPAPRRPLDDRL